MEEIIVSEDLTARYKQKKAKLKTKTNYKRYIPLYLLMIVLDISLVTFLSPIDVQNLSYHFIFLKVNSFLQYNIFANLTNINVRLYRSEKLNYLTNVGDMLILLCRIRFFCFNRILSMGLFSIYSCGKAF